jgi:hypothetical protein
LLRLPALEEAIHLRKQRLVSFQGPLWREAHRLFCLCCCLHHTRVEEGMQLIVHVADVVRLDDGRIYGSVCSSGWRYTAEDVVIVLRVGTPGPQFWGYCRHWDANSAVLGAGGRPAFQRRALSATFPLKLSLRRTFAALLFFASKVGRAQRGGCGCR